MGPKGACIWMNYRCHHMNVRRKCYPIGSSNERCERRRWRWRDWNMAAIRDNRGYWWLWFFLIVAHSTLMLDRLGGSVESV